MNAWEEAMWTELGQLPPEQQIIAAGAWITQITQHVLPRLGSLRRERVVEVLLEPGWDAIRLAETIGSRPSTIQRLAEEGRRQLRERQLAPVDETPP